jgi:hypothetical protein
VKYRSRTTGSPQFSPYAAAKCSIASLVTPYGLNGRVGESSLVGYVDAFP